MHLAMRTLPSMYYYINQERKKGTATMVEVKRLILDLGDAVDYGFKVNTYVNENIISAVNKELALEGKDLIIYGKWALFIDGQLAKDVEEARDKIYASYGSAFTDEKIAKLIEASNLIQDLPHLWQGDTFPIEFQQFDTAVDKLNDKLQEVIL